MIYTKEANFPYPLLRSETNDYKDACFEIEVDLRENGDDYILTIKHLISSPFLIGLMTSGAAKLVLLIKSQDNQFYVLDYKESTEVCVPKSKLSFNKKTTMQLMIQSVREVIFTENSDLNEFYDEYRNEIKIETGHALGFSDIVIFDGSQRKPFQLFEKKLNTSLETEIKFELTDETIIIQYKSEEIMFSDIPGRRALTNPYLYMGLERALTKFIVTHGDKEEGIELDEINIMDLNPLNFKLYDLMIAKGVQSLDLSNLDQVIHLISDNMLKRFTECIGGINQNAS